MEKWKIPLTLSSASLSSSRPICAASFVGSLDPWWTSAPRHRDAKPRRRQNLVISCGVCGDSLFSFSRHGKVFPSKERERGMFLSLSLSLCVCVCACACVRIHHFIISFNYYSSCVCVHHHHHTTTFVGFSRWRRAAAASKRHVRRCRCGVGVAGNAIT